MIWVTAYDVIAVHSCVIEKSGGLDGLRDRNILESAISAPLQSFGGKELFPTGLEKIARIGFGVRPIMRFWTETSTSVPW